MQAGQIGDSLESGVIQRKKFKSASLLIQLLLRCCNVVGEREVKRETKKKDDEGEGDEERGQEGER